MRPLLGGSVRHPVINREHGAFPSANSFVCQERPSEGLSCPNWTVSTVLRVIACRPSESATIRQRRIRADLSQNRRQLRSAGIYTACRENECQVLRGFGADAASWHAAKVRGVPGNYAKRLRGSSEFAWCADDAAQLEQQSRQQSGNLHLADAEFVGDVGLRALLEVTQPDQLAFGLLQLCYCSIHDESGFGAVDVFLGLGGAEADSTRHRGVDRRSGVALTRQAGLLYRAHRRPKLLGEILCAGERTHFLNERWPPSPDDRR